MPDNKFEHLELPYLQNASAKLFGGRKESQRTKDNKKNRVQHSEFLRSKASHLNQYWKKVREERKKNGAPEIPDDIPILLTVDPSLDIEALTHFYDFEIVSEQEDGFVLVASPGLDFSKFLETVGKFENKKSGGATAAAIHNLSDSEDQSNRIQRILSDDLFSSWQDLQDDSTYTVDIGIECTGKAHPPKYPSKGKKESPHKFQEKLNRYYRAAEAAYMEWDDIKFERESLLANFVLEYKGTILKLTHEDDTEALYSMPDSFTARIAISGKGLRDLVLNFPYIFEVTSPEEIDAGKSTITSEDGEINIVIQSPSPNSPVVCVIDSGIQEGHPLIKDSILTATSHCFLPGANPKDVADQFAPNGHGTRVAGAILFPNGIPRSGNHIQIAWLQNARVLDSNNGLPSSLFPPTLLERIVERFHISAERKARIFNHSIASKRPCPTKHMSAWAAAIDDLSYEHDVLFVQATGNLPDDHNDIIQRGIIQHITSGVHYPDYLFSRSSRIANPAQSLNAITVGSISSEAYNSQSHSSFSRGSGDPSSFTRTGLGLWDTIKPDVVEFGGDLAKDSSNPPNLTTPMQLCPELVRANNSVGPSVSRDDVGTSYAAPKVASTLATIQSILPNEPTLLYRALVAQSARWPTPPSISTPLQKLKIFGYGVPDQHRATSNHEHRVTLFSRGVRTIKAREAQIFKIPIPQEIKSQANDQDILVEVCLSYSAKPRRTRRSTRGYLGIWLDWECSKRNESLNSFRRRVCKDSGVSDDDGDSIQWTLGKKTDSHHVVGARRNTSTLQKDWAVIKAHQLPKDFCIAVVGHPGWDARSEATAKYSIVVSFEAINRDLNIYTPVKIQVDQLQVPTLDIEA